MTSIETNEARLATLIGSKEISDKRRESLVIAIDLGASDGGVMTKTTIKRLDTPFRCMECGKKYLTLKSAEKASSQGCTKCGSVDIDLDVGGAS